MPRRSHPSGTGIRHPLAVMMAGVDGVGTVHRPQDFGPARSGHPGDPDDFALADRQVDPVEDAIAAVRPRIARTGAGSPLPFGRARGRRCRRGRATTMIRTSRSWASRCRGVGDHAPVLHDRDTPRDADDLVEPMQGVLIEPDAVRRPIDA